MENLKQDYAIVPATLGSKALELAQKTPPPDVILLDVEMPEMNGYEVCQRLKQEPLTAAIDVIFVSSHDSLEEKIKGYEAGAIDYLIKPIDPQELISKVSVAIKNHQHKSELSSEKASIMSGFMEVLTSSGELGVIIEFLRQTFAVKTFDELAAQVVTTLEQFSLKSTVQIRSSEAEIYAGSDAPVMPLEKELLSRLKDQGRILEHGKRMFINHGAISIFIKTLPEDDKLLGRLRDHLAMLAEGADAKVAELEMLRKEASRKSGMQELMKSSQQEIVDLLAQQKAQLNEGAKMMDELMQDLEDSFMAWGLTEDQEQTLLQLVEKGASNTSVHIERSEQVAQRFQEILNRFATYAD